MFPMTTINDLFLNSRTDPSAQKPRAIFMVQGWPSGHGVLETEELMRKGGDPFEKSFLRPFIKHSLLKEKIA